MEFVIEEMWKHSSKHLNIISRKKFNSWYRLKLKNITSKIKQASLQHFKYSIELILLPR